MMNLMETDFTSVDDRLAFSDNETLDSGLDMFISKLGFNTVIADKFTKSNSVKINNNDGKTEFKTNENITNTNKNTINVPSCNL